MKMKLDIFDKFMLFVCGLFALVFLIWSVDDKNPDFFFGSLAFLAYLFIRYFIETKIFEGIIKGINHLFPSNKDDPH